MKVCPYRTAITLLLLLVCAGSWRAAAQSPATVRLLDIINSGNENRVEDELLNAAVDAGPPAIPALRGLLGRFSGGDKRLWTLGAIATIGGDDAITIIRQEYQRTRDEDIKAGLAAVLSSVDSPGNRAELVRMLSDDPDDSSTIETAALSLGLLRAREAISALRTLVKESEPSEAALALKWIEKGYWNVAVRPSTDQGRAIAAVLRNGSPNIKETDYVFDEEEGYWKHSSSGWTFSRGEPAGGNTNGPTIGAHVGAEGSRALVRVDLLCGPRCGTGYAFVLRREGAEWKIQMMAMLWIA